MDAALLILAIVAIVGPIPLALIGARSLYRAPQAEVIHRNPAR